MDCYLTAWKGYRRLYQQSVRAFDIKAISHLLPTLLFHHVGVGWEVLQLGGFRTPTLGHRSAIATPNLIHASIASSSTVCETGREKDTLALYCQSPLWHCTPFFPHFYSTAHSQSPLKATDLQKHSIYVLISEHVLISFSERNDIC